ncbi:hypothetical protein V6C53_11175 [Desulfocurvibacter africanus]|uniref:hypothetical protein n=1 Tax=Desulfocurvibacter africanus TaxID=873 RepID=UPI002FD8ECD1
MATSAMRSSSLDLSMPARRPLPLGFSSGNARDVGAETSPLGLSATISPSRISMMRPA